MQKDSSGFPSHHPLPDFMKGKPNAPEGPGTVKSAGMHPEKHTRRAFFHDYRAPGFYLITATALPGSPRFSEIPDGNLTRLKKGDMIIPCHMPLGEAIRHEILGIPAHHPEMRILRFVVMPDHIHFVLEVKERLKRMLGRELAGFFGACSKASSSLRGLDEVKTLFAPYFERIIFTHNQLERAIRYVEDNPRRLIIKRKYPELFRRYLHLEIGGHEYAAYGNIFLLKGIYLLPIRIHRRWSQGEMNDMAVAIASLTPSTRIALKA